MALTLALTLALALDLAFALAVALAFALVLAFALALARRGSSFAGSCCDLESGRAGGDALRTGSTCKGSAGLTLVGGVAVCALVGAPGISIPRGMKVPSACFIQPLGAMYLGTES